MILNGLDEYLIVDVMSCLIIDDNDNVIACDRLTSNSLEITVEAKEVRGGKGNGLIATVGGNKNLSITTSEPVFRYDVLAMQLGTAVSTGAGVAYKSGVYDVVGNTVTLEETPISGSIKAFGKSGAVTVNATGKTVNLTSYQDEKIRISYKFNTSSSTEEIEINSTAFPTAKKLVLETLVVDTSENPIAYLQMEIPKAKPDGSFSLATQSEKEAVATEITWTAMADNNGKLGVFKLIPITGAAGAAIYSDNINGELKGKL